MYVPLSMVKHLALYYIPFIACELCFWYLLTEHTGCAVWEQDQCKSWWCHRNHTRCYLFYYYFFYFTCIPETFNLCLESFSVELHMWPVYIWVALMPERLKMTTFITCFVNVTWVGDGFSCQATAAVFFYFIFFFSFKLPWNVQFMVRLNF